jgi:CheY-like chemotaxis protein
MRNLHAPPVSPPMLRPAAGRDEVVNTLRVLLVEDDALIGALLAELLSVLGHDVCATATTEADAVAAAAQYDPDLILVDVTLKEGDGVSAMRTIARTSNARHVFMTGTGRREFPDGAVILQKPFCESDLLRALAQVVDLPAVVCSSPV